MVRLSLLFSLLILGISPAVSAMKPPSLGGVLNRATDELAGPSFLVVHGPIKLTLRTIDADVDVMTGNADVVSARVSGGDGAKVQLSAEGGDRVEISFDGAPTLRSGRLGITVPVHSAVEIATTAGSIAVTGTAGQVRARTASGDVRVERAQSCELGSISGAVDLREATDARVDTVSGHTTVESVPVLRYSSSSGDLSWSGPCGAGCRLEARTLSGKVAVRIAQPGSFELRYQTEDGKLDDQIHLERDTRARASGRLQRIRARIGAAEGLVEVQTWHGDLALLRLP